MRAKDFDSYDFSAISRVVKFDDCVYVYPDEDWCAKSTVAKLLRDRGGLCFYTPGSSYLTHTLASKSAYHMSCSEARLVQSLRLRVMRYFSERPQLIKSINYSPRALGYTYYSIITRLRRDMLPVSFIDSRIVRTHEPPDEPKNCIYSRDERGEYASQIDLDSAYNSALVAAGGWGCVPTHIMSEERAIVSSKQIVVRTYKYHVIDNPFDDLWMYLIQGDKRLRLVGVGSALNGLDPESSLVKTYARSRIDDDVDERVGYDSEYVAAGIDADGVREVNVFSRRVVGYGWYSALLARSAIRELMGIVHLLLDKHIFAIIVDSVITDRRDLVQMVFDAFGFSSHLVAEGAFEIFAPCAFRVGEKVTKSYKYFSDLRKQLHGDNVIRVAKSYSMRSRYYALPSILRLTPLQFIARLKKLSSAIDRYS
ncbi:MAG: hypothetical protein V2G41_09970 [bacterium JZ-2024 1]